MTCLQLILSSIKLISAGVRAEALTCHPCISMYLSCSLP